MLSNRHHCLAEFALLPSRSGEPTVMHVPTGHLLHSAVDPVRESSDVADSLLMPGARNIVLLGGGLGYLAEAIAQRVEPATLYVVEPNPELWCLAQLSRSDSAYARGEGMNIMVTGAVETLHNRMAELPANASVIISPYLSRLTWQRRDPFAGFSAIAKTEHASNGVYSALLTLHERRNAEIVRTLPNALSCCIAAEFVVVAGAGPSLDLVLPSLRTCRSSLAIIAASGAVPSLLQAGIVPDWVIALEAREAGWLDLQHLPDSCRVIVFPSTDPRVVQKFGSVAFRGISETESLLSTRGGSSVIPALDFALRCSTAPVAIVGADLQNRSGHYAKNAQREASTSLAKVEMPLKFAAMRSGLELLLERHAERSVYHVLERGMPLRGTRMLAPLAFEQLLSVSTLKTTNEVCHAG